MSDEKTSFKSGDRVRIKGASGTLQSGSVIGNLKLKTSTGFLELIWVRLPTGKVDGFNPGSLEKMYDPFKRRAA